MSALAIHNGAPVRSVPFPAHNTISREEIDAAVEVMRTGILSRYIGAWHENFMGGPQVQAFEADWAAAMNVKHAIAVNSATSGLIAAIGAAGVGPGDEVIVTPLTMSASVTAIVVFNAVPVFADVDPRTFCLDPESIRRAITPRTRAIMAVDWFGLPADFDPIMAIAKEHKLVVIEDAAQAPFATYKGRKAGTLSHMGVFSLNYHKHIHTGEGGFVTTDDDDFADRVRLIRNHAESVVARKEVKSLVNMIGFNFRLGEIEASIGRQQLAKLAGLLTRRQENVRYLETKLSQFPGLTMPYVPEGSTHAYYTHGILYDRDKTGIDGPSLVRALRAELPPTTMREGEGALIGFGSVRPLYMLPMFQTLTGYGSVGCPFLCPHYKGKLNYAEGLCPTAENLHRSLIVHEFVHPTMSRSDLDDVARAFDKVWDNLELLRNVTAAAS